MNRYEEPRCPVCGGKVLDFEEHVECVLQASLARYDETHRDDYTESDER